MSSVYNLNVENISQATITHNLNRLDLSVRILSSSGEERNDLVSYVIPSPTNVKNVLNIGFNSEFSGRIQVLSQDIIRLSTVENPVGGGVGASNFSATTDPASSNNLLQGYRVGSTWYNTIYQDLFTCTTSTTSTATWQWQYNFSKYISLEKLTTQTFTTALSDITWDATPINSVNGYYSFSSNRITINRAGNYKIQYGLTSSGTPGTTVIHRVIAVGTRVAVDAVNNKSEIFKYCRESNARVSAQKTFIESFLANDQIRLQIQVFSGSANTHTIQTQGTFLQIERVG